MKRDQLVIQSNRKALEEFYPWFEKNLGKIDFKGFNKNNIFLVSFEMATNAVLHGNKENSQKKVTITMVQVEKEIIVSILDEGAGVLILPSKKEAKELDYLSESGRGLKLAVLLSDEIEYNNNAMRIVFKQDNNL